MTILHKVTCVSWCTICIGAMHDIKLDIIEFSLQYQSSLHQLCWVPQHVLQNQAPHTANLDFVCAFLSVLYYHLFEFSDCHCTTHYKSTSDIKAWFKVLMISIKVDQSLQVLRQWQFLSLTKVE